MRVVYHLPLSPYSRKVRLVLAEKHLPFELRVEKAWERRPEYLDYNPAATVPTLIIIGTNDPATTPADGLAIHAAIRGSRTVTLDAGHISNVEQPEAFIQAVAAFLAG